MALFTDINAQVAALHAVIGDVDADTAAERVSALDDQGVVDVISAASALVGAAERLRIIAAGVASSRSRRTHGHSGLAQARGHRTPVALVQELTGSTRADAAKHVRLGESLLAASAPVSGGATDEEGAVTPWHSALGRALLSGDVTSAQHDAIMRGLGEPPLELSDDAGVRAATAELWSVASEELLLEARERTVEELARVARSCRDQLDPAGATRRFDERYASRSFRMWTDADGLRRGSISFDDEMGAWVAAIVASALRPRRGGPRFVDADERKRADDLAADPRTNDQLAYDLLVDTLRAGALADVETVFGTRQAGVRVVVTSGSLARAKSRLPAVGLVEDDQTALPASLIAQRVCDTGSVRCELDPQGDPLYLGRESRLFSPKQRIALALRDGGCRWRGCDRPSSYCEAHHIDHFERDEGRTDIDRGILLCRFHHMQLHHGQWRITREGSGDFVLHAPGGRGDPIVLVRRLALRYAWGDLGPPDRRFVSTRQDSTG